MEFLEKYVDQQTINPAIRKKAGSAANTDDFNSKWCRYV